jgi:carboxymethylenebutenolidase
MREVKMGKDIEFNFNGVSGSGYLALPKSAGAQAVIVIQEWWGLVPHIKEVVDRLASEGFVAYAPDLYHGQVANEPDVARKLLMELELDQAAQELKSAAGYLLELPEVSSKSVGTLGFCMGGALAIWSATICEEISSAVGYYPGQSWERHNPPWENMKSKRVQMHCSEGDGTSKASSIVEAITKITAAGGFVEAFDYPNTLHAFFNDDRPEVFNKEAAELSWNRTIEFLKQIR